MLTTVSVKSMSVLVCVGGCLVLLLASERDN